MEKPLVLILIAITSGFTVYSNQLSTGVKPAVGLSSQEATMSKRRVDSIRGKTLRWTFTDGLMAGIPFEHTFHEDGTVLWRALGGSMKGSSAQEKEYAAVKIADNVYAVSYLAASGHTLTVVLNFKSKRMNGFASNDKQWYPMTGTFEVLK